MPTLNKTGVQKRGDIAPTSFDVYRDDRLAADDRAFFLKVRDVVEAAVSETTFRQIALKMQKTREIPLTGDPVKAVTHYSQEVTDYDRATDFEALGGKLIELPASDWREMVTAG